MTQPAASPNNASVYLMMAVTVFGWGISWPFLKIALEEVPPWTFRGLIAPSAALFIFVIALALRQEVHLPRNQWRPLLLASFLNITCWHLFSALGIRLMGGGEASIIAYTMPLWAIVLSLVFLGERPSRRRILGIGTGFAGLAVLLVGDFGVLARAPLGTLFMLISAAFWGAGTVVQKRVDWQQSPAAIAGWQLLIGGAPITLIAIFIEVPDLQPVSAAAVWSTVFVLIYPIVICWFAWFSVIRQAPVTVTTVATLMVPVLGVFSSNLILGEPVGLREVSSLVLICLSLALVLPGGNGKTVPEITP